MLNPAYYPVAVVPLANNLSSKELPSCFETASKMRILGWVLVALGVILVGATIWGSIAFHATFGDGLRTAFIATTASLVTLTAFGCGIFLIRKDYWRDPQFISEKKEEFKTKLAAEGYRSAMIIRNSWPEEMRERVISSVEINQSGHDRCVETLTNSGYHLAMRYRETWPGEMREALISTAEINRIVREKFAIMPFYRFVRLYGTSGIVTNGEQFPPFVVFLKTTPLTQFFVNSDGYVDHLVPLLMERCPDQTIRLNEFHETYRLARGHYYNAISRAQRVYTEKVARAERHLHFAQSIQISTYHPLERTYGNQYTGGYTSVSPDYAMIALAQAKLSRVRNEAEIEKRAAESAALIPLSEQEAYINHHWSIYLGEHPLI